MTSSDSYEVAVVGAGLAGLTAGARLAERGVRVAVLEKGAGEDYPCNARISGGVFHICFRHIEDDEAGLMEAIERNTRGFARNDLASVVTRNTRTAVQWFKEKGARFERGGAEKFREMTLAAPPARAGQLWQGHGGGELLGILARTLQSAGGTLHRGASAKRLCMDGERCVGLEVDHEGRSRTIAARNVILCDGGFQANQALVREFIVPHPEKLRQRNSGSGAGDALRMARDVGARLSGMDQFYGHLLAREAMQNDALWPYPMVDPICTAGLVVDAAGRRFTDEGLGGVYMTNQVAHLPDPLSAIAIFDEAIWSGPAASGHVYGANPGLASAGADILHAQDLPSLARALGLPAGALESTIAEYNAAVRAGQTERLNPPRTTAAYKPLPIAKPPYHALRLCAGITFTMGGIAVDDAGRVLNERNEAIPGLYAAGCCTGGLDGGPNAGYVGGLAKSAATGLRTADHLAAVVRAGIASDAARK
jgi:fumarate reductase flavoprotein subunit